jgi:hypothetical protein
MRIFSSAEYCRRVRAECPLALVLPALYPARISASSSLLAATMNQKSSVPQVASFVSQALKRDNLYRLNTSPDDARRLLLIYLARVNELADHPEFYHLLTNSCTINIVRFANATGRGGGFELRHLLNCLVDGYLYDSGVSTPICRLTNSGDAP